MESQALFPQEVEEIVKNIRLSSIKHFGDPSWWKEHESVEKLYIQAVLNVTSNNDEFVKDFLIRSDKVNILIHNLIVAEVWSSFVYPLIKKNLKEKSSTLSLYMGMYHGVSLCGLLETILYYQEVCETCGDEIVDLIDFVSRKINALVLNSGKECIERNDDELGHQHENIEFTLGMKSISLIKCLCNNLQVLPLSCIARMLNKHDFPYLLATLVDISPWNRQSQGKCEYFDGQKWKDKEEYHSVVKIEGQVWLSLYQLLLSNETQRKYEFTSHRKAQLLKLRKYLNEVLLDQIPHLVELQRFLEYLAVTESPSYKEDLLIEQVPIVYSTITKQYNGKWKEIANFQFNEFFSPSAKQLQEQAKVLAGTYNLDLLEQLIDEPPVCVHCGTQATNRCSRCRNEWYCSRPCQVNHWSKHKQLCDLLAKTSS